MSTRRSSRILLIRQAQLNALLDLDKGERQVAPDDKTDGSPEAEGDSRRG